MPDYRISLWNYGHYSNVGTLEETIAEITQAGFGVELWPGWHDTPDLYDPSQRERLRALLKGVRSSWHTGKAEDFEGHKRQVDCAGDVGSDVIVVHLGTMLADGDNPDFSLAREVVAYARDRGVTLCLENGALWTIERAIENVEDLMVCIDTGHTYQNPPRPGEPPAGLRPYVDSLKDKIRHLHVQDTLPEGDHYTPGTGTIPREDWQYFLDTLREVNFQGAWVTEIRPRRPLRTALDTFAFLESLQER